MVLDSTKPMVGVVEDDDAVRESLSLMLERKGYAARAFASPNEFLLAKDRNRYSRLIVDFQLPG